MKFRLGLAGEPNVCSHCYSVPYMKIPANTHVIFSPFQLPRCMRYRGTIWRAIVRSRLLCWELVQYKDAILPILGNRRFPNIPNIYSITINYQNRIVKVYLDSHIWDIDAMISLIIETFLHNCCIAASKIVDHCLFHPYVLEGHDTYNT